MSTTISKLLKAYNNRDFATQEVARFTFFTTIGFAAILGLLLLYIFLISLFAPNDQQYAASAVSFILGSLLFIFLCLFLVVKGYYLLANHILFSSSFIIVWLVMWTENTDVLSRFDTIVFIFSIFTVLPLLIRRSWFVILYLVINGIIACFFVLSVKSKLAISDAATRDFMSDTIFALIISAFGSYSAYIINERILKHSLADIKTRTEAEEALLKSELRFSDLTNMLPQPVYETDQTGRIVYANANAYQTFGYTHNDLSLGLTMSDLIIEDDRERATKVIHQIAPGTNLHGNFYTGLRKDKSTFPVQVFTNLIFEDGIFKGFRGVILDITDRIAVEEKLKSSRDQFQSLVSNIPGTAYRSLYDEHWTMLYISEDIERITGYPKDDFINNKVRSFASIIYPEDNLRLDQIIVDAISDNVTWEIEYRIIHKNGLLKWVSEKGRAILNEENEVVFFDGIIVDITYKKEIEDELQSYRHHLEYLVQMRTLEFERANSELAHINSQQIAQRKELEDVLNNLKDAQARLIQSEKMASLGVLVAGIAHEINNPLNFINAGAIGLDGYINDNLKEHAEELNPLLHGIQEGVKRAADIVTSLSHYSRRTDNLFVEYDLHLIIDNALIMLQSELKNRIDVVKNYHSEPLVLSCNEGRIHQVFLNILVNAAQSITDKGTITITTSIHSNMVVVEIVDTGCGIQPESLSKITDPFYTTKPPGKGTGLGLSISYNIILEHQGALRYISQPNHGTTAIITLPVSITN